MAKPLSLTPPVDASRGAPFGRPNVGEPPADKTVRLVSIWINSAGYDGGGAYWGRRPRGITLYCAAAGEFRLWLDAPNRQVAKANVLRKFPTARI